MTNEPLLAISTFPDRETAIRIVRAVIEKGLAACGNVLPEVQSIYRWKGVLESSTECMVLFKLNAASYGAFEEEIRSLHPYEVPEIVALPITKGLPAYLDWLGENSAEGGAQES